MVRGGTLFSPRKGWLHSGYLERREERVDYIARIDLGIVWVRYQGDSRFTHSWQCAYICPPSYRSKIPRLGCPFCGGMGQKILIYRRSLRCIGCIDIPSMADHQKKQSIEERRAIRSGDLEALAQRLKGTPSQAYRAILAMEIEGLRPRQFTVEKRNQVWRHKKSRSLR